MEEITRLALNIAPRGVGAQEERGERHDEVKAELTTKEMELAAQFTLKHQIFESLAQNDRESLNVGLAFLDANCTGKIEPSDVPDLTAAMFNKLDVDNSHDITPDELQRAVRSSLTKLSALETNTRDSKLQHAKLEASRKVIAARILEINSRALDGPEVEVEVEQLKDDQSQAEADKAALTRSLSDVDRQAAGHRELLDTVGRFFFAAFRTNVWDRVQREANQPDKAADRLRAIVASVKNGQDSDPLEHHLDPRRIPSVPLSSSPALPGPMNHSFPPEMSARAKLEFESLKEAAPAVTGSPPTGASPQVEQVVV